MRCFSEITKHNVSFTAKSITLRLGWVKCHNVNRTTSNINDTVYKSEKNYYDNCSSEDKFLELSSDQKSFMSGFLRLDLNVENPNLISHGIKDMNINIYSYVLNFKKFLIFFIREIY